MPLPFLLLLHLLSTLPATATAALTDCPTHCGNLAVPFPFGTRPGCHHGGFLLTCNDTFSPPRTFLGATGIQVASIHPSNSTATVHSRVARHCYTSAAPASDAPSFFVFNLSGLPYAISSARNRFIALGCDTLAYYDLYRDAELYPTACVSICNELRDVADGRCSGIGCCKTDIPVGLRGFNASVETAQLIGNQQSFSPCGYAFLIDRDAFQFAASQLTSFYANETVPVVLDWAVGRNESCEAAAASPGYLCGGNSYCRDSAYPAGYRCLCRDGYEGNPYDPINGCEDIDECKEAEMNNCSKRCRNTAGSYFCYCPHGYKGDGMKSGSGCYKHTKKLPLFQTVVGCWLSLLFILLAFFFLYYLRKKRRMFRLKECFFKQNGGLLLEQQLSAREGVADTARIFTAEELERATDNYAGSRVLGHGGNGTVYKGVLPDGGRVVAIKRSHSADADAAQIEQFINEVVLLSQVVHKNVVRLLGCCLETRVPLLVYEYVPNGTLDHHLHRRPGSLGWAGRLRVAGETAEALAYLHSAIARPIFHRDVKAANILLDDDYMAKMSDFGASRLIPLHRAQITTLVIGTLGYLDPEYFHTGQLTEKSDVYSFGVVLAELLTGQKPISGDREQTEVNLAIHFILRLRDGKLEEMLEQKVRNEGRREQIEAIAELARRCLGLRGEERPTMREVAAEIERVRRPGNGEAEFAGEEERWLLRGAEGNALEAARFGSSRIGGALSSEAEAEAESESKHELLD